MTTLERAADQSDVTARFRRAVETHDLEGVIEMRELMRAHFATVENLRYFTDVGDAQTRAQFYRATVDGQQVEAATRVEVNDQAQISEITIYYRPLPGLTALTATLGSHVVAARHGHRRALTARLLFAPLALVIRFGDHFATWFA